MSEANIALAKRWYDEVWNQRRTATIAELLAPDAVAHNTTEDGGDLIGPAAFLPFFQRIVGAFPDLKIKVEDVLAHGDKVVVRWTATMHHTGDSLGIPATYKPVSLGGMSWVRFANGQVVEGWDNWDKFAMLQQIGAIPPLAAKSATS
jgi:steroid delta-isomerase-like uncharacterized protein